MTIYVENDNLITLTGLQNEADDAYANAATVTYILKDSDGATVDSGSLAYVAASDGKYQAVLEDDLTLTAGGTYTLTITADAGGDLIGKWTSNLRAQTRRI